MVVAARLDRGFRGEIRKLAEPGEVVVFSDKGDHLPDRAGAAHERSGYAGEDFGHFKALGGQFVFVGRGRGGFAVAGLGRGPDPVRGAQQAGSIQRVAVSNVVMMWIVERPGARDEGAQAYPIFEEKSLA